MLSIYGFYVKIKCYLCKKPAIRFYNHSVKTYYMKKFLQFLLIPCTAIIIFFSSCHKSLPKQTLYIPQDATFVLGMDPKSLAGKLSGSGMSMDSLFKTFGDTDVTSKLGIKSWDDLKSSGLDWESEFFFFVNSGNSVMNGQSTSTALVAAMKDEGDFASFLKKSYAEVVIKKDNNYSYAILKYGFVVGWNSDVAILSNVFNYNSINKNDGAASQKQLAALFAQKEDASVASVSRFKELVTQKADMLFWTNFNSAVSSVPFIGMTKASDLLKDSYSAGTIDFEDGKAVFNSKYYTGKDLGDIFSKYAGPTVNMNMVDRYPSPLTSYSLFSFNPQIIQAIITYIGIDGTVNQFLQQVGLSMDDILKAFKGDFGVMVSDFGVKSKPNEFSPGDSIKTTTAKGIVDVAIGDKKSYDKVIAALASKGIVSMQNGQYTFVSSNGFAMSVDDKDLILSSDSVLLQQYKAGNMGKSAVPSDIVSKTKGSSTVFYIDIAGMLKNISVSTPESMAMLSQALQTFKNFIATSENFNGTSVSGTAELNTINDKENSLVSILKLASQAAKSHRMSGFNYNMPPMADSTMAPPDDSLPK